MAVPPASRLMVSVMLALPVAVQVEPLDATQVHVAPLNGAGSVSVIVAPVTLDGPLLVATIV